MLKLFNSLGKRMEPFRPVDEEVVTIFTCGPSIYQRAHIGNFRTFLFEDVLVRYLEYLGYTVKRGMNVTDIEDKAIREAEKRGVTVKELTERNIDEFIDEMNLLRMKIPDYLPSPLRRPRRLLSVSSSATSPIGIVEISTSTP